MPLWQSTARCGSSPLTYSLLTTRIAGSSPAKSRIGHADSRRYHPAAVVAGGKSRWHGLYAAKVTVISAFTHSPSTVPFVARNSARHIYRHYRSGRIVDRRDRGSIDAAGSTRKAGAEYCVNNQVCVILYTDSKVFHNCRNRPVLYQASQPLQAFPLRCRLQAVQWISPLYARCFQAAFLR